jgi:hypothetical protein
MLEIGGANIQNSYPCIKHSYPCIKECCIKKVIPVLRKVTPVLIKGITKSPDIKQLTYGTESFIWNLFIYLNFYVKFPVVILFLFLS